MPYSYRISTNAIHRIQEASSYLENVRSGYGFQFDLELQECIDQLCEFPESGNLLYENRRKSYLISIENIDSYKITVRFDNQEERVIDFKKVFTGNKPFHQAFLEDYEQFKGVEINGCSTLYRFWLKIISNVLVT